MTAGDGRPEGLLSPYVPNLSDEDKQRWDVEYVTKHAVVDWERVRRDLAAQREGRWPDPGSRGGAAHTTLAFHSR